MVFFIVGWSLYSTNLKVISSFLLIFQKKKYICDVKKLDMSENSIEKL